MSQKYSNTDLHRFIKSYVESKAGKVDDVCEEFFSIEMPGYLNARKFTYQPMVSREKKIELIATGSRVLESIVRDCLSEGVLSSIVLKEPAVPIREIFKDTDYGCDFCEKVNIQGQMMNFCTKSPKCYHKINNTKINSMEIMSKEPIRLFQFFFSVLFRNRLRKNEELITILLDERGNLYDTDLAENMDFEVEDSTETTEVELFDKLKMIADARLDSLLADKKNIFDMLIRKQASIRLKTLEKRLEEERLQGEISRDNKGFDEEEWLLRKSEVLRREEESLRTRVSIKFLNLLVVTTHKINFKIDLMNGAEILFSYIPCLSKSPEVKCTGCGRPFFEGYATEDGFYLCKDCIIQSLETGKIYSKNYSLAIDSTTYEYMEESEGFRCSVCGKLNSKFFEFRCNYDGSYVCYACYSLCVKCGRQFSNNNIRICKDSGKPYCISHIVECDNCGSLIGIDRYRICQALQKKVCSCTRFAECELCGIQYSVEALSENKCPACRNLTEATQSEAVLPIIRHDSSFGKTKKWFIGKNKMNTIAIAKGVFSDTLFAVKDGQVIHSKRISFLKKIKGY